MAFNLPLPNITDITIPKQINALNELEGQRYANQIAATNAQYAPLTTQAEAASKLAYANLMGPQFLAKLFGNTDILANIPDPQKREALSKLYAAGTGQGTGSAINSNFSSSGPMKEHPNNGLLGLLVDKVKGLFGQNQSSVSPNALLQASNLSPQDKNAIQNMQPGQSFVVQGNQGFIPQSPSQNTFAENVGTYGGIAEEGKEAGRLRAKDINDLSDIVFSGETKQTTLDEISNIIKSPEFEQIRQVPILGHNELSYYQRYGTPAQQNMIGQLMTLSGNVIRDASQDFKGAFRKGEQELLNNMKINPGDTFDAARGKMEQLSYLNKMITQRAKLTAQYMSEGHINKLKAEELADKQLNGQALRNQIHNELNPKPTDIDIEFMAKKYKTTPEDIRKKLKAKGIL